MTENELLIELNKWFDKVNLNATNFWNKNQIGKLIRSSVAQSGHWRKTSKIHLNKLAAKKQEIIDRKTEEIKRKQEEENRIKELEKYGF
jgi:hypothetical protein